METVSYTKFEEFAIQYDSRRGNIDAVDNLINVLNVNPSTNNNYPIRSAIMFGHIDVVNLLISDPRVYSLAIKRVYHNNAILKTLIMKIKWRKLCDKAVNALRIKRKMRPDGAFMTKIMENL